MSEIEAAAVPIQFKVHPKESIYHLLSKWASDGIGIKGYVPDKIRDVLKMYDQLSELYKEEDPIKLLTLIASRTATISPAKTEQKNDPEPEQLTNTDRALLNMVQGGLKAYD